MKKIILASASPRRQELIGRLIPDFKVMTDDSPEEVIMGEKPEETVKRLAKQKAENIAGEITDDAVVIAADTMVALDGQVLGKPCDEKEAYNMLKMLSGNTHQVYTGVAVIDTKSGKIINEYETTGVKFRTLLDDEIKAYIKSGEPMDKAGAYGIQELGALFIQGIEGDYFNVVGLPLCRLGRILKEMGIDLLIG